MNFFLHNLKAATNFTSTENGAVTHKSTGSKVYDMFALGGAYRNRSDEDCIALFKSALAEDETFAMKCLFYLRDVRGGQGERRFFRVCFKWLAKMYPHIARRNLEYLSEYGRWDDLIYACADTPLEADAFRMIRKQLQLDVSSKTPSLLAKWMPSENASSGSTKKMATKLRTFMGMDHRMYRKTLSKLRERIRVVERLMSANRWDEIEFDKIPSKAGLIYRNAFARRDIIAQKYAKFAESDAKVKAETLNPVDIANRIFDHGRIFSSTERAMLQKYWDCQPDFYGGRQEKGIAVVDVSGSMSGQPMNAAVSMGAYIAERGAGPFANHFITFSTRPELVEFDGVDVVDKFLRCREASWGMNTNLEAVFDLLLSTARKNHTPSGDMPERIYIFSDMEFDSALASDWRSRTSQGAVDTLCEGIAKKWKQFGYELPSVIFWNLDARHSNIPALGGRFSCVSGFSMDMVECILSGKDGIDLMIAKLSSERYSPIH